MKLAALYRVRFEYLESASVALAQGQTLESQYFFRAEGTCQGRIQGAFRGANHARRRGDGTFEPHLQGVITTDDGASVLCDYRGYGRAYPEGRRQIVIAATHLCDDPRYAWLNDSLAVGVGEVRAREGRGTELVIDLAELVWEPIAE